MGRIEPPPDALITPPPQRTLTERQQALQAAAELFQKHGAILLWHGNPYTGTYTHFEVLAWRGEEDAD